MSQPTSQPSSEPTTSESPSEQPRLRCPTCGSSVPGRRPSEWPSFPFCTPRCKLIDLGRWLSGDYRIAGRPNSAEPEEPS